MKKIKEITKNIINERRKEYLIVFFICILISLIFYSMFYANFEDGIKLVNEVVELGFNLFIFFPSLSFVVLGIFPSFPSSFKVKLVQSSVEEEKMVISSDGSKRRMTKIESYLEQYIFIMYWSIINLVLSLIFVFVAKVNVQSKSIVVIAPSYFLSLFPCIFLIVYLFVFIAVIYELYRSVELTYNVILEDVGTSVKEYQNFKNQEELRIREEVKRELLKLNEENEMKKQLKEEWKL